MKAITLTQPWASLMVAREAPTSQPFKRFETRSFSVAVPHSMVIHAGKCDAGMRSHLIHPGYHRFREPYASLLNALGYSSRDPWFNHWPSATEVNGDGRELIMVPLAAVVGAVRWCECTSTNDVGADEWEAADPVNFALGNYDVDRYAWQADQQVQLPRPIPCRGAQGFWTVPDNIMAQITAQGVTL